MLDLFTEAEDIETRQIGWSVEYVFDCKTDRFVVAILPTHFTPQFPHAGAAGNLVLQQARAGNRLAVKALQLFRRGFQKPTGKKK